MSTKPKPTKSNPPSIHAQEAKDRKRAAKALREVADAIEPLDGPVEAVALIIFGANGQTRIAVPSPLSPADWGLMHLLVMTAAQEATAPDRHPGDPKNLIPEAKEEGTVTPLQREGR